MAVYYSDCDAFGAGVSDLIVFPTFIKGEIVLYFEVLDVPK